MPETTETIDKVTIKLAVNGEMRSLTVEPRMLLVELTREQLDLTGTQWVAKRPIAALVRC